eukprot:5205881-Pleurochrysis_carterae.AAC.2
MAAIVSVAKVFAAARRKGLQRRAETGKARGSGSNGKRQRVASKCELRIDISGCLYRCEHCTFRGCSCINAPVSSACKRRGSPDSIDSGCQGKQ